MQFMELQVISSRLLEPTDCSHSEADEYIPCPPILFLYAVF